MSGRACSAVRPVRAAAGALVAGLVIVSCAANGDDRTSVTVESTVAPTTSDAAAPTTETETSTSTTSTTTVAPSTSTIETRPPVTVSTVSTVSTAPTATLATIPPQTVATVPVTIEGATTTIAGATTTTTTAAGGVTTTTTSAVGTTTTSTVADRVPPDDLRTLLLSASDLGAEWDVSEIESYEGERDAEIAEACPSADALNRIDLELEWRAEYTSPQILSLQQMVGEYPSTADAVADVEEAAQIGECDLEDFFFDSDTRSGPLDLASVDAASTFIVDSSSEGGAYVAVVAIAVGPAVSLIILTGTSEPPEFDDVVELAAAKMVSLTR